VFLVMNFRVSIKQILARMRVVEKKKDLKVIVVFKKEIIPFLRVLRREGVIFGFAEKKKTLVIQLKKKPCYFPQKQRQKVLRDFDVSAILYKNPAALVFLSTTFGVCTKSSCGVREGLSRVGGKQLFWTD
jgi:ribosomal protein S8